MRRCSSYWRRVKAASFSRVLLAFGDTRERRVPVPGCGTGVDKGMGVGAMRLLSELARDRVGKAAKEPVRRRLGDAAPLTLTLTLALARPSLFSIVLLTRRAVASDLLPGDNGARC